MTLNDDARVYKIFARAEDEEDVNVTAGLVRE